MSHVDHPDPARAARFLEELVAEAEADRVMAMSDEELLAVLKAEGREPWAPESTEALVARLKARAERKKREEGKERAAVVPLRSRSSWWTHGVGLLAAAAVLLVVGVSSWHREQPLGAMPDEHEKARELRREAFAKCEVKDWRGCAELLDRAGRMDPAGDGAEAVKKARREIDSGSGK